MGCKSTHARAARREPRASCLEPQARARALVLGNWSLGCSLGLVLGPSCGLGPSLVGLVLFRPPPFPRQRAKRDDTSSV